MTLLWKRFSISPHPVRFVINLWIKEDDVQFVEQFPFTIQFLSRSKVSKGEQGTRISRSWHLDIRFMQYNRFTDRLTAAMCTRLLLREKSLVKIGQFTVRCSGGHLVFELVVDFVTTRPTMGFAVRTLYDTRFAQRVALLSSDFTLTYGVFQGISVEPNLFLFLSLIHV